MQAVSTLSRSTLSAAALLAAACWVPVLAHAELAPRPSLADVIKASKPTEWRALDPDNTMVIDLQGGRVVIELAPRFAPKTAANIRALVRERYFDGLAILRVQDNFVTQWGDPDDETNPRPYKAARTIPAEFTAPLAVSKDFTRLPDGDVYAPEVGHQDSFPVARDPARDQAWLPHCYGMIGVARDNDADSGNGSQLYAVIGHAPRHLDRNITVVGRVVSGMALLSGLTRGSGAMGFYDKAEQRAPLVRVRMQADLPQAERSHLELMRTDSASYQAALEAQRNRGGPWNKVATGKIDLCNAPLPVREQPRP